MRALVITPTTGAPELVDAIKSVSTQTYTDVDHLIVCDGEKFKVQTDCIVNKVCEGSGAQVCYLPYNTGGNGFYGHRIMAAFSHLVNHDVVLFLDQDNSQLRRQLYLRIARSRPGDFQYNDSILV